MALEKDKPILDEENLKDEGDTERFLEQLHILNRQRAEFLFVKTQYSPDEIENYLNEEPEDFDELSNFTCLQEVLTELLHSDDEISVAAIIDKMPQRKEKDSEKAKRFAENFSEELHNREWKNYLANPYGNDQFRAQIAKLKGLSLYLGRDAATLNKMRDRLNLWFAVYASYKKLKIPDKLFNLLPDGEKEELTIKTIDMLADEHKHQQPDEVLRTHITIGSLPPTVMLQSLESRAKIAKILKLESEAFKNTNPVMIADREKITKDFDLLLAKYPNPGVIIDLLLER